MGVHSGDRPARGLREEAGHHGMNQASEPGAEQANPDCNCAEAVTCPCHAERSRMIEEQAPGQTCGVRRSMLSRHSLHLASLVTPTGFEPVALRLGI